tara:strand:- start:14497 stop:14637 length:141 start_codon:yes stop_codon:yes gene_type:complete
MIFAPEIIGIAYVQASHRFISITTREGGEIPLKARHVALRRKLEES